MVWVPSAGRPFWGISLPVSHPKNSYSTRLRCSSVTAASLSGPSETSAPSTPTAGLTTASKKPSSSAEAAVGNAAGRPPQPSREVTVPWHGAGAALREACSAFVAPLPIPGQGPSLPGALCCQGWGSSRVKGTREPRSAALP